MSKRPSRSKARKPPGWKRASVASKPRPRKSTPAPSRIGKKALVAYYDPEVSRQLKQIVLDRKLGSVQELLREALNDLFKKHKKPTIA